MSSPAEAGEEVDHPMSLAISAPLARVTSAWNLLIESLLAEQDFLIHQVLVALREAQPAGRALRLGALHGQMASNVVSILSEALRSNEAPTAEVLAQVQAAGGEWAHHGVSVEDLLGAWHRGIEAAVAYVRDTGQQLGVTDAEVLRFVQCAHESSQAATVAAVRGFSGAQIEQSAVDEKRREAFVQGVVFGTLPMSELASGAETYGLDPNAEYFAVRARITDGEQRRNLEHALGFDVAGESALCAVVDGALVGFLTQAPPPETRGIVGFGPRRPLRYLAESYRLASRALSTMHAYGLRGAREFAALSMHAAVVGDGDVGDVLRHRYLDPLSTGDSAREVLGTLRAYFECDMHVERTASRLFVHQNTVRYRLARFEELTGANLRSTQVIVELWWALALSNLGV